MAAPFTYREIRTVELTTRQARDVFLQVLESLREGHVLRDGELWLLDDSDPRGHVSETRVTCGAEIEALPEVLEGSLDRATVISDDRHAHLVETCRLYGWALATCVRFTKHRFGSAGKCVECGKMVEK